MGVFLYLEIKGIFRVSKNPLESRDRVVKDYIWKVKRLS